MGSLLCSAHVNLHTCSYMANCMYSLEGMNHVYKSMFVYIPPPIFSMDLARSLILVLVESAVDVSTMRDPQKYVRMCSPGSN